MAGRKVPTTGDRRAEDPIYNEILGRISNLNDKINAKQEVDASSREKINSMYKILVTGNGTPPLPELVRKNTEWISEQKDEQKERKKQNNQILMLGIGQLFGLIALAVSIWIGLR